MSKQKIIKYCITVLIISFLLVIAEEPTYTFSDSLTELENLGVTWLVDSLDYNTNDGEITITELNDNIYIFEIKSLDATKNTEYIVMEYYDGEEQINIIEYGTGMVAPYTSNVIIDNELLAEKPITIMYFSALESYLVYSINNYLYYIDSSTGDVLPDLSDFKPREIATNYFNSKDKVSNSFINNDLIFDPYYNLNWLIADKAKQEITAEDLIGLLNANQPVLYSGAKYNDLVKFAYPVIGYQQSDDKIYLALYDFNLEMTRYIELNSLLEYGYFTKN